MLELRAEEAVSCVGGSVAEIEGSAVDAVGDAAAKCKGDAVVPAGDTEVETERAFINRVSEKLLGTIGIW